jgi:triacylglycerol lipase
VVDLVRSAGWVVRDAATAARLQLEGMRRLDAPADFTSGRRRPVLALPGVYETWRFMLPLVRVLHDHGHPVHVVPDLAHNSRPIADSAELVARLVERLGLEDVVIVAHSKGGLIGKYAMVRLDPERRITRMLAVASPFSGSRYAAVAPSRALRAFRASDPVTVLLAAEDAVNSRITSVYPAFDPIVPEGSELPGAENVRLPIGGHWTPLTHPTTWAIAVALAAAP